MNRKPPLRTYQRKNAAKATTSFQPPLRTFENTGNFSVIRKSTTQKKPSVSEVDHTLDYDPFDTTFDRIVKNAKVPLPPTEAYENASRISSDCDSSEDRAEGSESLFRLSVGLSSNARNLEEAGKKVLKKKVEVKVTKRKLVRKKKTTARNKENSLHKHSIVSVGVMSKVKKKGRKPFRSRKKEDKNASKSIGGSTTVLIELSTGTTEPMEKKAEDVGTRTSEAFKSLEVKPCFVVLDRASTFEGKNDPTSDTKVSVENTRPSVRLEETEERDVGNKTSSIKEESMIEDFENKSTSDVKPCFVKVERLSTDEARLLGSKRVYQKVVSSTPIGKVVRFSAKSIPLSPIPISFKKYGVPDSLVDSTSIASNKGDNTDDRTGSVVERTSAESYDKTQVSKSDMFKNETTYSSYASDGSKSRTVDSRSETRTVNSSESSGTSRSDSSVRSSTVNSVEDRKSVDMQERVTQILTAPSECTDSVDESTRGVESSQNDTEDTRKGLTQEYQDSVEFQRKRSSYSSESINGDASRSLFGHTQDSSLTSGRSAISTTSSSGHLPLEPPGQDTVSLTMSTEQADEDSTSKENTEATDDKEESNKSLRVERSDREIQDVEKVPREESTEHESSAVNASNSKIINVKDEAVEMCVDTIPIESKNDRNSMELRVQLTRLPDVDRITKRRKRYRKWDLELENIFEDTNSATRSTEEKSVVENGSRSSKTGSPIVSGTQVDVPESRTRFSQVEQPIYLKPGKSWLRSLSILSNIQNESMLEQLAVGKGKNWRDSVRDILEMQQAGIIQSCVRKSQTKEPRLSNEIIDGPRHASRINRFSIFDTTTFGRLSKRVSIRVVPTDKNVKCAEDRSFLEAYGIVPARNQRSTLKHRRKTSLRKVEKDTCDGEIVENDTIAAAREVILQRCSQKEYVSFSDCFSESYLERCKKIGEGVYGEVFLYERENEKSVIKIIPIEGSELVNGEPQKKFHEILSEIVIAKELHDLRFNENYNTDGFVQVKNIKCIVGKYPDKLVELWNIYDEEKRSDNDSPSMFNEDQLYIALELSHGGQDLEAFVFHTAEESYALFVQAALALAVAEKAVEFEHRDLHWGNVLISRTDEPYVYYQLDEKEIQAPSKGVKVSIIDFTLSRMSYQGCCIFNDLASDPALFTAQGEYQFEIYRLMRDRTENNWQQFQPYTNVLWLHYTLDKMITAVRYKKKNLKVHKIFIAKLEELKDLILSYASCFDFVNNCDRLTSLQCNSSQ